MITGLAPASNTAEPVAVAVNVGIIISEFFLIPRDLMAIFNASVPLLTPIAYLVLKYFFRLFSNFLF